VETLAELLDALAAYKQSGHRNMNRLITDIGHRQKNHQLKNAYQMKNTEKTFVYFRNTPRIYGEMKSHAVSASLDDILRDRY
jgi:hypothetical protein